MKNNNQVEENEIENSLQKAEVDENKIVCCLQKNSRNNINQAEEEGEEDGINILDINRNIIVVGRMAMIDAEENNHKVPSLQADNYVLPEYREKLYDDELGSVITEEGNWIDFNERESESDSEENLLTELRDSINKRYTEERELMKENQQHLLEEHVNDDVDDINFDGIDPHDKVEDFIFDPDFDYDSIELQAKFGFSLIGEMMKWGDVKGEM